MSLFFEIVGWVVLLVTTFLASLKGQAIFRQSKRNVELALPIWLDLSVVGIAALFQIFLIKNVWLAVVIWAVIGIITGYIAGYTNWYLRTPSGLRYLQSMRVIEIPAHERHASIPNPAMTEVHRTAVKSLLETCPEVTRWMRDDPSPPMKGIREIGENLNAQGGKKLMREVHAEFVKSGGAQWSRNLEMMWDGIGDWRG